MLAQRDSNWRAFVCDNASSEPGVEELVHACGEGRIAYHRNPTNLGMAGNFNRCFDLAGTDLVTLLHADDELLPDYCATMRAAAARHPGAVAIYCNAEVIGSRGEKTFELSELAKRLINPSPNREFVLAGEPGVRALMRGDFITTSTLCFRKSVLGARRWPQGLNFVLDLEFLTSLMLDGDALVGLPNKPFRVRRHRESETARLTDSDLRFLEESAYFDRMQVVARERGWTRCLEIARRKRIVKLHLAVRTLQSAARLDLGQIRRRLELLWKLQWGHP